MANDLFRTALLLPLLIVCLGLPATATAAEKKVSDAEQIEFLQKNASAQMQELQERMFRLAELTKQTEPGDSARLLLAVRKAREQLIIEQMKEVLESLNQKDFVKATDEQKKVITKLEALKRLLVSGDLDLEMQLEQLRKMQAAIAKLDAAIKEEKRQRDQSGQLAAKPPTDAKPFDGLKKEQEQNRKATDAVAQMAKELGEPGAKAGAGLGKASSSMSSAEAKLGGQKAGEAKADQEKAVEAMQQARAELEKERQKLLEQIEKQVRAQVIANLTDMLERQTAVRNATEAVSSKLASGEREATLRVKQLANAEKRIVDIADQTVELIEETQFSIALPPAIKAVQRRMIYITADLGAGKAGDSVITMEMQVEKDLKSLIETMKEASKNSNNPGGQCQGCNGNKNKLLAELKVLRLLQLRVNEETVEADQRRASVKDLDQDLRNKIGSVRENQQQVQTAMDRLHQGVCPHCLSE